ncbi:HAD family hydrolase [Pontiella desulfatans]|nr:HAD family phosphatase [Pontiella desulfatans]
MKTFLFDIGHVLVDFDFDQLFSILSEQSGESRFSFSEEDEAQRDAVERGLISDEEWVAYLNRAKGFDWSLDDLVGIWRDLFTVNETGYGLFRKAIGSGVQVYTLSNIAQHHMDAIEANWNGFFNGATGLFLSYEVGARKPNPDIYRHALDALGVSGADCFFLDDLPENVEAARSLGINAHRFIPANHGAVLREAAAFFDWS